MEQQFSMKLRVSSYDVGPTRRLRPSVVLMMMQEAAGRHLEGDGLSYEKMRDSGIVFLLVKEAVKVTELPYYGDEITIKTWFEKTSGVQFLRGMRFCGADGRTLLEAHTCWVIADPATHRILRPGAFPFEMPCALEQAVVSERRILAPGNAEIAGTRTVRYSDIDCNHHMNNSVYADLICDFFPGGMGDKELCAFQIDFEGEASLGDEILVKTAVEEGGGAVFEGTVNGHKCFKAYAAAK